MTISRHIHVVFLSLLIICCGCSKVLQTPPPGNQITVARVYADDADAQTAMAGVYIAMMDNTLGYMNGSLSLDAALSADELVCTPPFAREDSFQLYQFSAEYVFCNELFNTPYTLLYDLNSMMAGLAASRGVTPPVKAELEGEVRFNRALLYFYLVNLFGDVPLVLTTDYTVSGSAQRAPVDSVYGQIVSDLQAADSLLPVNYLTATGYTDNRTRPNQAAAQALLARVWLYLGQWAFAEAEATAVIDNQQYWLESLDNVFLSVSQEAIWQLQPVHGSTATADAHAYLSPPGRPSFILTSQLIASMEPGDQRRAQWVDSGVYQGQMVYFPYKYKLLTANAGVDTEYEMVLRLAEQYLIRAEARAQQGDVDGAIADLNKIRERAGLPDYEGMIDASSLLAAILQERRVELFTEWGHRWLDLKRSGQASAVLGMKPGWESTDVLYPIPATELSANPGMMQNPGYQ
jgi:hypothetical protein